MNDFFDFKDVLETKLGAKKKTKKKTAKKQNVKKKPAVKKQDEKKKTSKSDDANVGKCAFIDSLIREGFTKEQVLLRTIKKFPGDIPKKTEGTVNARFSSLKHENIQLKRPTAGTKIDFTTKRFPPYPFSCFYNPRTDDYDFYWS
jgi:hypothetical protein